MAEDAFLRWQSSLRELTDSADAARAWRERRYRFAHQLGQALVAGIPEPVRGNAIYGVWLSWGLLYVGQTSEAERRLRDLAVGESHHLANTFPPEIWQRVVVLSWERLPEARRPIELLGAKAVGLALEHRLQILTRPLANAARRTVAGAWRDVRFERSGSAGARVGPEVDELFDRVRALWEDASTRDAGAALTEYVRCVFPAEIAAGTGSA